MESEEIHYLTLDPDELWRRMHLTYIDQGGEVLYPGSEKEMLLRGVQAFIMQTIAGVDNALRMATLRYAVRDYLDLYGEKRWCYRINAMPAECDVTLFLNSTGKSAVIEAGTTMTHDGEVIYETTEDVIIDPTDTKKTVHVRCTQEGRIGNSLTAGTEMQFLSLQNAVMRLEAASDATGGQEKETDDAYRERIRLFGLMGVTTGPTARYEGTAKSVSSDVIDARAVNGGPGIVNVYVLLREGADTERILSDVNTSLDSEENRPLTDYVHVYESDAVPYTLNVRYSIPVAGTEEAIRTAVREYQEWQENTIGRAFNPDVLFAKLYQAGATRVVWGEGSNFNGRENGYHLIEAGQHCKGTIYTAVM